MKTLILVRHATAVERKSDFPDFERTLVKKGVKESKKMAKRFASYQVSPDIWISSSAPRALETATIFSENLLHPKQEILLDDSLYQDNSAEAYLALTQSLPKSKNSVIYFGHEPGISEFAALLVKDFKPDFPKAGIMGIIVAAESWENLGDAPGFITLLEFPGSGKTTSKILKIHVSRFLFEQNRKSVSAIIPNIDKKLRKILMACSTQMTKAVLKRRTKS